MEASTVMGFAVAAMIFGGVILAAAYAAARLFSLGRAPHTDIDSSPAIADVLSSVNEAVVVARRGGSVISANDKARQLFRMNGGILNLSHMARLAQPQESFLALFAAEGRAALTVANRSLEATSVRIPGEEPQFVVVLRESGQLAPLRSSERSAQAIASLSEINKKLSASLDLKTTLDNILQIAGRIVQYDLAEVTLYDPHAQVLRPQSRAGDRTYLAALEQRVPDYKLDEGYTGWIARHKRPLLVNDIRRRVDVRPKFNLGDFPLQAIVGVPLLYGAERELIGTLEMASFDLGAYSEQDVSLLETLAEQAAVAIRNAQLYARQGARIAELSGLAEVAKTASALADRRELYASLIDRIAQLMSVRMCGFLLYDARERALVGQSPFRGVPNAILELYRIAVPPGSLADNLWREEDYWLSNDARQDAMIDAIGLKQLAQTLGMRTALFAPLVVAGQRLGLVQVANKVNDAPFGDDDVRLLRLFSGQAAALIDNARLVREAEERVGRAEALRQISEITGSARRLEEICREVMTRTAHLIAADKGVVLLLDETKGELGPQPGSEYGGDMAEAEIARRRTDSPDFKLSVTVTRRPFFAWRASRDRRIAELYAPVVQHFRMESLIIVPLVVQDKSIGEMWLGARRERTFARSDVELVATVASQLAAAIERERLASATDQSLRRRIEQLTALTRVGRELNQTLELEHILRTVYDEAVKATRAECGSILLLDMAAASPAARIRLGAHSGHLALDALEIEVALSGASYIVGDLSAPDALDRLTAVGRAPPPDADRHGIRSLLIVPIIYQGATVGVLELHSPQINGFDRTMLDFSQALAAQAAVAVGNARRYEEQLQRSELLRRRADQLSQLLQISRTVRSDRSLAANLETIACSVQEAVGFNVVLISVLDPNTRLLHRTAGAGLPLAAFEHLKQNPAPWSAIEPGLQPQFQISQSYFIPHDKTPPELARLETFTTPSAGGAAKKGHWHQHDVLFAPLIGSGGQPLGLMRVDDPRDGVVPDRLAIETLEIFANQAALAIENARLFEAAESRTAELSSSLAELQKSYRDLDAVSRVLTRKEQELSALIEQTELRAGRLLALHRIASAAAEVRDEAAMLQRTAEATVGEMNLDVCLIALLDNGALKVIGRAGTHDSQLDIAQHLLSHNPLGQIVELRSPLLARELGTRGWGESKLVQALGLRSFVAVPISIAGRLSGGVLVGSQSERSQFSKEDIDLFTILASQIGVGIENIRLYAEASQRSAELAVLYELGVTASQELDLNRVTNYLFESVQQLLQADSVALVMVTDSGDLRVEMVDRGQRLGPTPIPRTGSSLSEHVLHTRQPLLIGDLQRDDLPGKGYTVGQAHRAWLGVPLLVRASAIGVLSVQSDQPDHFGGSHLRLLGQLGNQLAVALDNARLFSTAQHYAADLEERVAERTAALEKERDRVETLLRINNELAASLDLDRILTRALSLVNTAIGAAQGSLFLIDSQSEQLIYRAVLGSDFRLAPGGQPAPFGRSEGLVGWVIRHREPVIVPELSEDERWLRRPFADGFRSAICVPLASSEESLGAMIFFGRQSSAFNEDQLRLVAAAATQVTAAVNNAELYRLIRDQAERLGGMLRANQVEASKSRAILESVADGVMVSDADGKIVLFNATAERILQISREDILDRPVNAFMGLYGAGATALADAIQRWSSDPSRVQPGDYLAERIELDDKRIVSVLLAPVTSTDEYLGTVSIFRDITREVEVDRLKTEFVTTVSHELRTPMTSIKGYADLLLIGAAGPVTPDQQRFLDVIKSNADRLKILVDDLLDISKIESGKAELHIEPLNIGGVINDVAAHLKGRLSEQNKPLNVTIHVPDDLPPVSGDRQRITQILTNLADNAFTYTHADGSITLSARCDQHGVIVSVADTGIGIAPEERSRIFERFFRGQDPLVLASAGAGLGLSIVQRLVEMHGGRIWVESEGVGRGSTFYVWFRLHEPALDPAAATT